MKKGTQGLKFKIHLEFQTSNHLIDDGDVARGDVSFHQ
jgi:hypothetical protein